MKYLAKIDCTILFYSPFHSLSFLLELSENSGVSNETGC